MIKRLRRRMTLMVIAVLILVSAGIVLAIHLSNERNIAARAEDSLAVLAVSGGSPESPWESPPPKPDDDDDDDDDRFGRKGDRRGRGRMPEVRSGSDAAGLSNFYTITLNKDGSVASWTSERADLYSDGQVADIVAEALADGRSSGRVGTQFYRKTSGGLVVLDARLDYLSASGTLRSAILIAAASCALLSLMAWLLIRRMVQPVEDAFNKQKQFVSDASHELKTPLAVISANAEVLEQEIGENEYLGYIRSEVRRTDALVNSLLTLARMDKGGAAEAVLKPFDLSRALLDVVLPFESTVYEAGKTMDTDIPEGIFCTGSEEMIKQLAVILLSNALKYSDEGGRIGVSLKVRGRQREIRVFNTGVAIAPADQEHIFDRFWRADPAHGRETGGHGLGLAIARTIVETHRGKITVDSREGFGTAFTVTLNA